MSLTVHIPVLVGAPELLVSQREERGMYLKKRSTGNQTNRAIKLWAVYFQLKALTTSGVVKAWQRQKNFVLPFLQINENTFRSRIKELQRMELLQIQDGDIILASYKKAAEVLGLGKYSGTFKIPFNHERTPGKQTFQYFLRAEEIRTEQETQLDALTYHIEKNPTFKTEIFFLLQKTGSDPEQLKKDAAYFQQELLKLQLDLFKAGSDLFGYVMTRRADINRSVHKIKDAHGYKGAQSVSYMKRVMRKLGIISIDKKSVQSNARTRHYVPTESGGLRDGYKWIDRPSSSTRGRNQGFTVLFLTDQITINYNLI